MACLFQGKIVSCALKGKAMGDSHQVQDASRRDALKKIALGSGGMITLPIWGQVAVTPALGRAAYRHPGGEASPDPNWKPLLFDAHQNETVVVLTEMIIPETDTPGAKAALVDRFIDLMLSDENSEKQRSFIEGLAWIDGRSLKLYGKPFVSLKPEQQTALLTPLADPESKNLEDRPGVDFFQQLKDFTLFGYYTSKIGMEQELEYGGDDYHAEFPGACTHPQHQT